MNPTVLVVDDNDDLRELTALRLEMAGIPTQQCANGKAALGLLGPGGPSIVLSDMRMPYLSGSELLRLVRDNGGDQLFIFFSGEMNRRQINEMVPLGVFEFLEKGSCDGIVDVVKSAQAFLKRAI